MLEFNTFSHRCFLPIVGEEEEEEEKTNKRKVQSIKRPSTN